MRSGYIVYVDESGDHSLTRINPDYPMFVLAFCIFPVDVYVDRIVPLVRRLKFDFFNHDMVVLNEREMRQSAPPFDILLNASVRSDFMARIDAVFDERFGVIASAIRKHEFVRRVGEDTSPYHVALEFGLERVFLQLQDRGASRCETFVVFESRGRSEDRELEAEFDQIMSTTKMRGMPRPSVSRSRASRRTVPGSRPPISSLVRSAHISSSPSSSTARAHAEVAVWFGEGLGPEGVPMKARTPGGSGGSTPIGHSQSTWIEATSPRDARATAG